jgi:hypothetical protein
MTIDGFTEDQEALWEQYADAREEADDLEFVLGFQTVCDLEGIDPPSEEAILAALG